VTEKVESNDVEKLENERFEGSYIQWLWHEMKQGNTATGIAIWFFGFGFQLALFLTGAINWLTFITIISTLIGLYCTTLMMAGSPLNGPIGLLSVIGFIVINVSAGHYWSVLDQLIFAACIDIPLMFKWRTWGQNFEQKARKLTGFQWVLTFAGMTVLWAILYPVAIKLGDTQPIWDSLVLAIGATASLYCVLHVTDLFKLWLMEDLVNLGLWIWALKDGYSQAALPMLVSTLMYTATAIYGQFFSVWHTNGKRISNERKANK
jgi:nicotinamide mononucleotide transporter PnuC